MCVEKTIFLYSKNNYEFAYKLKKICKEKFFILKNINSFADLFLNQGCLVVPVLFVDTTGLDEYSEIKDMLIKLTPKYFKKLVLFFDKHTKIDVKDVFVVEDETDIKNKVLNILNQIEFECLQIENLNPKELCVKKVSNYLTNKGFYLKHAGSQMIRDAIIYCHNNPSSVLNFSATVYNFLAIKYNTSLSNVERSIRRAIDFVNQNTKNTLIRMTNKEFIMQTVSDMYDDLKWLRIYILFF